MLRFIAVTGIMVLFATVLLAVEAVLWAELYLWVGALPSIEQAMLYSLGAITAYGDAQPIWPTAGC